MKKIIFVIFILLISSISANAQWIQQNSGVNAQLYKVKFLNRYTGWTCGQGVILKTTNGGDNWLNVPYPATNKNLYGLFIIDSNTVYVSGYWETILKTTNSGQSWIEIKNGPWGQGNTYRSVYFINKNTGWFGTNNNKVLKTTNAGLNFDEYSTILDLNGIYDLYFKDSLNGLLINNGDGPYKTTNGGVNWYYASIYLGTIHPWFYNVSVLNNQYCFLPGADGRVFKSTNFGETWDSLTRIPILMGTCSASFPNLLTGWVGGNYFNKLYKTTNGGINWAQENSVNFGWFSIYSYNELVVWGVSAPNFIMHTTTGGQPFSQISNNREQIANDFILYQNYPNPFNLKTVISYWLMRNSFVNLKIYDLLGREIKTLVNEFKNAGSFLVSFNGSEFASGVYFYRIQAGNFVQVKRMVLIK